MNNFMTAFAVVAFLAVGAIAGFYFIEWQPVDEEHTALTASIEELEKKLDGLKSIKSEIKKYENKLQELTKQKSKLQTDSIGLDEVVPKLLDSTETIANKFKVKFQDIRISPLVRAEDWSELPVEMTVLGTFNDINCFFNVMEARKIINLAAGSMNVAVSSEVDKENKKSPMLSVTLSAKVYILDNR